MTEVVLAAKEWTSNAALIADVARLGYLQEDWSILDVTYGPGAFWKIFRPRSLTAHDINPDKAPHGAMDFRDLAYRDGMFDAVVFDGPYQLTGTPALGEMNERFGTDKVMRWQERMQLLIDGLIECARVTKASGYVLMKCQDQVCSGKIRWQTRVFTDVAENHGLQLVDRFDMLGGGVPQPMKGRTQKHAHGRPSTLLIFKK